MFQSPFCERRAWPVVTVAWLGAALAHSISLAQGPEATESSLSQVATKVQALQSPGAKEKKGKEKDRPPFEFLRTQVAPFDVLPLVKENHWSTITVEARSNEFRYDGWLQSAPVSLWNMPHEMVFRREDRLDGVHSRAMGLQVMLPRVPTPSQFPLEFARPGNIRGDAATATYLQKLEPHQMLVVVLGSRAADYANWSRFLAFLPTSAEGNPKRLDAQRYYRLVMSLEPTKQVPPLSPHPITWTTISHVIWDDLGPERLDDARQSALIDWLHWGGQLIIMGGAGPSLQPLQNSFLGPYLPADLSGNNANLTADDLRSLSDAHLAPYRPDPEEVQEVPRYRSRAETGRLQPLPGKTVFLTGLAPRPGSTVFPLGDEGHHILGVERRVGRGRILMIGIRLTEKTWAEWPGLDTLVRRVVLRRGEEQVRSGSQYSFLAGPELTWVRYVARDLDAPDISTGPSANAPPPIPGVGPGRTDVPMPTAPVSAWLDGAKVPVLAREALQDASGLTIPGRDFALSILVIYVIALVPVNALICRFVLRRRELAWALTPVLAIVFALVVERAAARHLGFDTACDEIDVLELQGDYPRAHLSRFDAFYATGRYSFTIFYPAGTWPLALPQNLENALPGAETARSVWQSYPEPCLVDFPVQPQSLAMVRAEQMVDLPGGIELAGPREARRVINHTDLELRDAVVIEFSEGQAQEENVHCLGTIAPGASVSLRRDRAGSREGPSGPANANATWLGLQPLLEAFRSYSWNRPEDHFETRLVAWAADPHPGQTIHPGIDRHRGLRIVVAHLDHGPTPSFDRDPAVPAIAPFDVPPAPEAGQP